MESVEDISADAIMDGLPWDWNSYGEYLDSTGTKSSADIVGLVGHSSVRYEAMGDKSMDEGVQPDVQNSITVRMVQESMEAGAVGFSTSRFLQHKVPDGRCARHLVTRKPGNSGSRHCRRRIGSMFQSANDMATRFETELQMFRDGMDLGCQVLFSGGTGPQETVVLVAGRNSWRPRSERQRIASILPERRLFSLAQLSPFTRRQCMARVDGLARIADPEGTHAKSRRERHPR